MLESMSTNFQRKYNVDIKAMFENGCPSYPSLLKPPFRKKITFRVIKNIRVQKAQL